MVDTRVLPYSVSVTWRDKAWEMGGTYFGENFFELSAVDGEDEQGNEEGSSLHF